jgi:hypothetical protein
MQGLILMIKNAIIAIIITIFILSILFFIPWKYYFSADLMDVVGEFNTLIVEQIELAANGEIVTIADPDEINAIINCFNTEIFAVTRSYDSLATGGCGGYHWDTGFSMRFIGNGYDTQLNFDFCDSPHQHSVSKQFINWTINPVSQSLYLNTGCYFLLGGYNLQGLSDIINKYINVKCVYIESSDN